MLKLRQVMRTKEANPWTMSDLKRDSTTELNFKAIPHLEELKEGVCDSLINLTFKRIGGFGRSGAVVFWPQT